MNYKLIIAFLIAIIIISVDVSGYDINVSPEEVKIESIYGANDIQANGDLKSNVVMFFNIPSNFSSIRDNVTIYFWPSELKRNEPIREYKILICDDPQNWGWNYVTGYDEPCNEAYAYSTSKDEQEKFFHITFTPKKSDIYQKLVFRIDYIVPNFIFKQGDYYIAWLDYPNMKNNMKDINFQITNYLVLPTKDDVPRFIPDAQLVDRLGYYDKDKILYRWVFAFVGGDDKIVWYSNDKEIKEKEEELQLKYTWFGITIGLIVSIILLFFEKIFFDWLPYGNNVNKWFIKKFIPSHVVGNINDKKYHQIDCVYVDNISDRNRKQFKNKKDAKAEGYTACSLCK